jgi:lipopolysaccharide transport system permease protein
MRQVSVSARGGDFGESAVNEVVIEAGRVESNYWKDVWRYRQLLYFLAWRDILVRYKQTVIGVAWAVVRPVLTMVVFTVVFSRLARLPSVGTAPYSVLVYAAMLPWQFFATSLSEASGSLVTNTALVSRVYFPRLIVPVASVVPGFVDFLFSFAILVLIMAGYQYWPDWRVLLLPLFTALASAVAIGAGLWLSALTVKYRDFRYIVPFVVQFGLYVSPVGFSSSVVPAPWRLLYSLNPLVGVIDGFRWALLSGEAPFYWPGFLASVGITALLCVSGTWYFRRVERGFADVI